MYELGSMAKALDMQKHLAEDAHFLHAEVTRRKEHDPEVRINYFSLFFCDHQIIYTITFYLKQLIDLCL